MMKKFAICMALGVSALFASAASAAPLSNGMTTLPDSNVQNVRMVCDENGRCWRQRGERRVIIRDSYDYAPPTVTTSVAATGCVSAWAPSLRAGALPSAPAATKPQRKLKRKAVDKLRPFFLSVEFFLVG